MKHSIKLAFALLVGSALLLALASTRVLAQGPKGNQPKSVTGTLGNGFSYQGQLKQGTSPVNGTCSFNFGLWDAATLGSQVGITLTQSIAVANGLFTSQPLDFGATAFDGNARYLQIATKCGSESAYTALTPRQQLAAAPYALYAKTAGALSEVLPLASGGTGSATKNFVDLSSDQSFGGIKTFTGAPMFSAPGAPFTVTSSTAVANLNADLLDGQHASAFQKRYQNVKVVAKSGGDYASITDALNSILDAGAGNRYLVYVAPGVYTETVTMKPFVDIQGAGEIATKITYTGSATASTGTVIGANDAELRFLTVENTGGDAYATAIYNSSASPHFTHVTAIASGGTDTNRGMRNLSSSPVMTDMTLRASGGSSSYGVFTQNLSSPTMMNVTISASGATSNYGVSNSESSPTLMNVNVTASGGDDAYGVTNHNGTVITMTNVSAIASGAMTNNYALSNGVSSATVSNSILRATGGTAYGIYNGASAGSYTVTVNNSQITGSTNTISSGSGFTTRVGGSQLSGEAVSGSVTCINVWDENFASAGYTTCP